MDRGVNEPEVARRLDDVARAEERLLTTSDSLDEDALAAPSLLPGWTRGHVLAHVALNAHSLVNLFTWARTGEETPQYPSWEERDADIERHAGRTADEHRAALSEAGTAFADAARAVPLERWDEDVAGIGGDPVPAHRFLFGRLREVEIHHVDLDAGYGPEDWDPAFVRAVLEEVPERFGSVETPFTIAPADMSIRIAVGGGAPQGEVRGRSHELLAWLLGRRDSRGLDSSIVPFPQIPSWG